MLDFKVAAVNVHDDVEAGVRTIFLTQRTHENVFQDVHERLAVDAFGLFEVGESADKIDLFFHCFRICYL